ncbi:MAG: cation:proton antiporter [Balneolales bacterium]
MVDNELIIAVDFAIIIISATILSLAARKTGQPAIVAYLFTGIILGPVFLNVILKSSLIELFSELGLAFLLFLIGFEMSFEKIKDLLRSVVHISIYQTILQTALAFGIAYAVGFTLVETFIIALCTVFGATPIIVKILADKKQTTTVAGRINIGVLIIQDIYLVIILAIFNAESLDSPSEIILSVAWVLLLLTLLGTFALAASRYVLPLLLDITIRHSHAFFVQAIAWGFLFISFTEYLELSVEIGAFLAGLSLGQLQYSAELRGRIRPITNFFMIIFFTSIGLRVEAEFLILYWKEAFISSIGLMIGNFLIMFYLIHREKFDIKTTFIGSINMTQVSEFSLVVGTLAVTRGFINEEILGYFSVMAIGTMSISTYLIYYNNEIYDVFESFLMRFRNENERDIQLSELKDHAIVIGNNALSQYLLPLLIKHYNKIVFVDKDPERVNGTESNHAIYVFGNINQEEIRDETAFGEAAFVMNLTKDSSVNDFILTQTGPHVIKILRSESAKKAIEYYDKGAHYVIVYDILTQVKIVQYLAVYFENRSKFMEIVSSDLDEIKKEASYV